MILAPVKRKNKKNQGVVEAHPHDLSDLVDIQMLEVSLLLFTEVAKTTVESMW